MYTDRDKINPYRYLSQIISASHFSLPDTSSSISSTPPPWTRSPPTPSLHHPRRRCSSLPSPTLSPRPFLRAWGRWPSPGENPSPRPMSFPCPPAALYRTSPTMSCVTTRPLPVYILAWKIVLDPSLSIKFNKKLKKRKY